LLKIKLKKQETGIKCQGKWSVCEEQYVQQRTDRRGALGANMAQKLEKRKQYNTENNRALVRKTY
jgi:hypothetical protein